MTAVIALSALAGMAIGLRFTVFMTLPVTMTGHGRQRRYCGQRRHSPRRFMERDADPDLLYRSAIFAEALRRCLQRRRRCTRTSAARHKRPLIGSFPSKYQRGFGLVRGTLARPRALPHTLRA